MGDSPLVIIVIVGLLGSEILGYKSLLARGNRVRSGIIGHQAKYESNNN